ncbi:MAG: alpha/beta hydrolase [Clostridiales bacterium]|nr:alpha/beta hydrolase [Clostridiales bacterium]
MKRVLSLIIVLAMCLCMINVPIGYAENSTTSQRKYLDIAYVDSPNSKQYLDIILPENGEGPFPVVMFVHGGAWCWLDKSYDILDPLLNAISAQGYAIVRVNYTLGTLGSEDAIVPQQIRDLKAAVRYLRANASAYQLDMDRIALLGESAGAHLALLTGMTNGNPAYEDLSMGNGNFSSDVNAILSFYCASDLTELGEAANYPLGTNHTKEDAIAYSPYYVINENCVPLYLTHGTGDEMVSVQQTEKLDTKAKEMIGEEKVTSLYFEGAVHGDAAFNGEQSINSTIDFLEKHLYNPYVERTYSNLPYVDGSNNEKQMMDIELPAGEGPFPVLMFLHGGGWTIGDKTDTEVRGFLDKAKSLGYAVANVNYRLTDEAQWPAQIFDCKAAVRYLRANAQKYRLDPNYIGAVGPSAGGHLALMLGTTNEEEAYEDLSMGNSDYSSNVQAVVSFYGVSDMTTSTTPQWLQNFLGGDPTELLLGKGYTEEDAKSASPLYQLDETDAPMLIIAGMNDSFVNSQEQSVDFAEKAKAVLGAEKVQTFFPAEGEHADEEFWNSEETVRTLWGYGFGYYGFFGLNLVNHYLPSDYLRPYDWFKGVNPSDYENFCASLSYADQSPTQTLDLYLPDNGEGPHKTIVFIHGGGWSSGSSTLYTARGALQALKSGYAVASVNYRLAGEATYPAAVYDIKAAIRYLRANADAFGLDPDNFAIWGESAGGHLADLVATTNGDSHFEDLSMGNSEFSSDVQACVSWYAVTDCTAHAGSSVMDKFLGGQSAEMMDLLEEISPINHISEDDPPFYMQHGTSDTEVHYTQTQTFYEKMVKICGQDRVKMELIPGANHAVSKFSSASNIQNIVTWLDEVLVNEAETAVKSATAPESAQVNATFDVTVVTAGSVTDVRLANENDMLLKASNTSVTMNEDGTKTWLLTMSVGTVGNDRTFQVVTKGPQAYYQSSGETVSLDITSIPPVLNSFDLPDETVANRTFIVKATTDMAATKIVVYNEYGTKMGIKSLSYKIVDGQKEWTGVMRIGTKGERTFTANAVNKYGAQSEAIADSISVKAFA